MKLFYTLNKYFMHFFRAPISKVLLQPYNKDNLERLFKKYYNQWDITYLFVSIFDPDQGVYDFSAIGHDLKMLGFLG